MQMSLEKHPELPDVPLVMDFAKNDDDVRVLELIYSRQVMGRPFVAPPDVPDERIKALRAAFAATMKDPKFLADAKKQDLEITPVSGEGINKLIDRIYSSSPKVVAMAKEAVESEKKTQVTKKEVPVETVSGTIAAVENGGRELQFKFKDKTHKVKVSGSRTKVMIGGKEAKRKGIKVGMACDVSYQGDGTEAKQIACK